MVEGDAPGSGQLAMELRFRRRLFRGKKCPRGVGDEIEFQPGAFPSVSGGVEHPERRDAGFEYAIPALGVGLARAERGEGGDDHHAQAGEQIDQVGAPGQGREVRAKQDARRQGSQPLEEALDPRHQLGSSAGEVDDREPASPRERLDRVHRLAGHDLGPARSGAQVTVPTGLVAQEAHVHLERRRFRAAQLDAAASQGAGERIRRRNGAAAGSRHALLRIPRACAAVPSLPASAGR